MNASKYYHTTHRRRRSLGNLTLRLTRETKTDEGSVHLTMKWLKYGAYQIGPTERSQLPSMRFIFRTSTKVGDQSTTHNMSLRMSIRLLQEEQVLDETGCLPHSLGRSIALHRSSVRERRAVKRQSPCTQRHWVGSSATRSALAGKLIESQPEPLTFKKRPVPITRPRRNGSSGERLRAQTDSLEIPSPARKW